MKKILTLVLCWLLAFSAIAETTFKAKTAASVAGGYVTSLNKVDGSFEDGTTGWVASVGTITATASTEFQGNFKGVWAGTGTGTLDLQWTATASNTYEASAQVNVKGEDGVYICAYIGTTETGCKLIPALSKIQKVSVVADSKMSSAFYLRLKHTGSDAFSVDVDDGKIEPFTFPTAALNETQTFELPIVSSGITYNGYLLAAPSAVKTTGSGLFIRDTSVTQIRLKALKNIIMSGSLSLSGAVGSSSAIMKNGVYSQFGTTISSLGTSATPFSLALSAGDYVEFYQSNPTTLYASYSITATALQDNVIQTWQPSEFLGEIKLLPTTTAPRGFIPADGKSIGKTSGTYQGDAYYALYALRWAMSSTVTTEPYVISSAKGASAQADWDAGKTITIDVRGMFFRAAGKDAWPVGAKQGDAFQGHYHNVYGYGATGGPLRTVNDANMPAVGIVGAGYQTA
ncbi:MAG: hypothetical protein ACMV0F_00765, partial [Trichlorobacter sp.]